MLSSLAEKVALKMLFTSRPHLRSEMIKNFVTPLQLEIVAADSDIAIYVSKTIQESENFDEIDDNFKKEIIDKVIQKAQRM